MKNVQIKTTELNEKRFVELFENSDCSTKGEFLNKLMQAYEKPVSNEKDQEMIKLLDQQIVVLNAENTQLKTDAEVQIKQIEEIAMQAATAAIPKGAIILDLKPEFRRYFWGVNEVCKKMEYSFTYEEMIEKVFTVCYKRGELVLSKEDCDYLDSIKYDLDEAKEGTNGK